MKKYLLISIHDVTPAYADEIKLIITELEKRGITKYALLITPYWEKKYAFKKNSLFVNKLLFVEKQGAEFVLHGLHHEGAECILLNEKQARKLVTESVSAFKNVFKKTPKGFIPPLWQQSEHLVTVLRKKKFVYTESFSRIRFFDKKTIFGFPIGMESASGKYLFEYDTISPLITRWLSRFYAWIFMQFGGVLRYSIHPRELHNKNFYHTLDLLDSLLNKGWTPTTYSELASKPF